MTTSATLAAMDLLELGANALRGDSTPGDRGKPPARAKWTPFDAQIFAGLTVVSPAMTEVVGALGRLGPSDVTLTLMGETGTGKDVIAHAVHDTGPRRRGPFVVFDCGAIPASLIESELFGHEKGAFTGAHAEHLGAFERAHGGTLFLDEIGELPLELQPRLLRALETRAIRRVGGGRERQVDVRILAATNRDLGGGVAEGKFRRDLFYRLAAAVIRVPPLRERLLDMTPLIRRLLGDLGRAEVTVASEALERLRKHRFPGNVRELKNLLACALALLDGGEVIEPQHLRFAAGAEPAVAPAPLPLGGKTLALVEQLAIEETLRLTGGDRPQAAGLLGISASMLTDKIERLRVSTEPGNS